jgi:hypothetical protein
MAWPQLLLLLLLLMMMMMMPVIMSLLLMLVAVVFAAVAVEWNEQDPNSCPPATGSKPAKLLP